MKFHTFRLLPGQNLREALVSYCSQHKISAATLISVVGGLSSVILRMPGATPESQDTKVLEEDLEIVSIEGTLGENDCHIHIAVSKKDGSVAGGHLKEGTVRITAEVTLVEFEDRQFARELDPETGFKELLIKNRR